MQKSSKTDKNQAKEVTSSIAIGNISAFISGIADDIEEPHGANDQTQESQRQVSPELRMTGKRKENMSSEGSNGKLIKARDNDLQSYQGSEKLNETTTSCALDLCLLRGEQGDYEVYSIAVSDSAI